MRESAPRLSPMYIRVLRRLAKVKKVPTQNRRADATATRVRGDATKDLAALGDSATYCKYYTLYLVTLQVYPRISIITSDHLISFYRNSLWW